MAILFCRRCGTGYGSIGEVPATCPACLQETTWRTSPYERIVDQWLLAYNDRKFLKSIRIAAEPDEDGGRS